MSATPVATLRWLKSSDVRFGAGERSDRLAIGCWVDVIEALRGEALPEARGDGLGGAGAIEFFEFELGTRRFDG